MITHTNYSKFENITGSSIAGNFLIDHDHMKVAKFTTSKVDFSKFQQLSLLTLGVIVA